MQLHYYILIIIKNQCSKCITKRRKGESYANEKREGRKMERVFSVGITQKFFPQLTTGRCPSSIGIFRISLSLKIVTVTV
jgi:hypothetical protein